VRPRVAGCCVVEDPRTAIEPHYILIIRTEKRQPLASLPLAISASPSLGKPAQAVLIQTALTLRYSSRCCRPDSRPYPPLIATERRIQELVSGWGSITKSDAACALDARGSIMKSDAPCALDARPAVRWTPPDGGCLCVGRPMGDWLPVR
jgi:hypothetical protein